MRYYIKFIVFSVTLTVFKVLSVAISSARYDEPEDSLNLSHFS